MAEKLASIKKVGGGGTEITGFTGYNTYTDAFTAIVGHRYLVFSTALSNSGLRTSGIDIEVQTPLLYGEQYNNLRAFCVGIIGIATSTTVEVFINRADFHSIIWIDLDA